MSDIRLIQLSNYVRPTLEENKAKGYVLNGRDNSFYKYIMDRNNGSVTNGIINKSYADMIYGKGLAARDASQKANQWAAVVSIIDDEDLISIATDFQVFGEASIQVVKTKDRERVAGIYHIPKYLVVPGIENEDGEIASYWYSKNWSKLSQNPAEEFAAFNTSKDEIEMYVIKPYKPGLNYFGAPDYLAALPWAEMEEEIANHCINALKNGLTAGYIINVPDGMSFAPEQQDEMEKKIKDKIAGSPNAGRFILSFNSSPENAITVEVFPVNEQMHKQWDWLTTESKQQIITGHGVTSPMLFGIKDNTGLGNNADELDSAEAQVLKRVVGAKQKHIINALKKILALNEITLDLYFKPLTDPVETKVNMSAQGEKKNLDTTVADELIKLGEDTPSDDWELVETKVIHDYDTDIHFTSTGTAIPNAKSSEDGKLFKSRFRYIGELSANSREFCRKMIAANKLYRLEDIQRMSNTVVNEGWGPRGADTYDIFLYKGGGACRHAWQRESYRLKADVNSPLAKPVTPAEARKAGEILPPINKTAATKPNDLPYNGFLGPKEK